MSLRLIWAEPAAATAYRPELLTADEQRQAAARRAPRMAQEWAVSRALLQSAELAVRGAPGSGWSLSHSQQHALLLIGAPAQRCGVDLERRRPRRVLQLAEWVCDDRELTWLTSLDEEKRLLAFYRLWTLKEALLKAAGFSFPAGMRQTALHCDPTGATTLRVDATGAWTAALFEWNDWTAAAAWQGQPGLPIQWQAGPASTLPPARCVWQGTTQGQSEQGAESTVIPC